MLIMDLLPSRALIELSQSLFTLNIYLLFVESLNNRTFRDLHNTFKGKKDFDRISLIVSLTQTKTKTNSLSKRLFGPLREITYNKQDKENNDIFKQ